MLKKWMTMGISVVMAAVLFAAPVYAHGHGHHSDRHHTRTERSCGVGADRGMWMNQNAEIVPDCPVHAGCAAEGSCLVCGVDGCTQTGHHLHENAVYCGYPHAGGYCDGTCMVNEGN